MSEQEEKPASNSLGETLECNSPNSVDSLDDAKVSEASWETMKSKRKQNRRKSFSRRLSNGGTKKRFTSVYTPTQASIIKQTSKAAVKQLTASDEGKKTKPTSLTIPISPNFRIEKRLKSASKPAQLSSDVIAWKKLDEERKAEEERIKKSKKLYEQLRQNKTPVTVRGTKKFLLRSQISTTSAKQRRTSNTPRSVGSKVVARRRSLGLKSSKKMAPPSQHRRNTIVQPFKFATDKRNEGRKPGKEFEKMAIDILKETPTAELIEKFFRDPRSHNVPKMKNKLTIPSSPELRTEKRGKINQATEIKPLSREEMEEAEMMEIRSKPFKARLVDKRIFESAGELGVPKIEAKASTELKSFHSYSDLRAIKRNEELEKKKKVLSPKIKAFKARALPTYIKQQPKLEPPPPAKLTKPMSPKMNGGRRASMAPERWQRQAYHKPADEPLVKGMTKMSLTQPKEFNLQTSVRGEARRSTQEMILAKQLQEEAEAREVKPIPLPNFHKCPSFKEPKRKESTIPTPFDLRSVARHEDAVLQLQKENVPKQASFRALPLPPSTFEAPKQVESLRPPLLPMPVKLASDERAVRRAEFNEKMNVKMMELELNQELLAKEKLEQANRKIKLLRRTSVQEGGMAFKAAPVLEEDPFPIKCHLPPPPATEAVTPKLKTAERASKRMAKKDVVNPELTEALRGM